MKSSSLKFSREFEESSPVNVPLSPGLKKSHSVGSGLCLEATFPYVGPEEGPSQQLILQDEVLLDEPFTIYTDQNQAPGAKCEDCAKNALSGLTKVRSLPSLAACGSLSLPPRSRSLDNLCSFVQSSHLEIPVNSFATDSSGRVEEDEFYDGTAAANDDGKLSHGMRRIEEWVRQINIQDGDFLEDLEEESSSSMPKETRERPKSTPRAYGATVTDAGQRYLSTMLPSSTTARMMNIGLAVIPFLGAFASLRVLDLSGNSIVRMTTGALPKGLHELNLSRNSIAAIEGLRELTRLRVLNLSYNRILRIGHGLGGCTTLKELYLGGNKIGEVEGLHRLLKLSILDLQKNKITTAKSLRQLAANYASLHALNLDGNPVLRNVGEDQLRRHLSCLLPRLVYLNKHAIKPASSKDLALRATAAVKSDRHHHRHGGRRAGGDRGSGSLKITVGSSAGGRMRGGRVAPLPLPLVVGGLKNGKATSIEGRLLGGLRPVNPMRRIQSEGTLRESKQI